MKYGKTIIHHKIFQKKNNKNKALRVTRDKNIYEYLGSVPPNHVIVLSDTIKR